MLQTVLRDLEMNSVDEERQQLHEFSALTENRRLQEWSTQSLERPASALGPLTHGSDSLIIRPISTTHQLERVETIEDY